MSCYSRQRGIAVLTAMVVVAIATILAVEIIWRTNLDLQRTESLLTWNQAQQYALGAENLAIYVLRDIGKNESVETVTKDDLEKWRVTFEIDDGVISGAPEDLQGRFNLNNLVTAHGPARGRKDPVMYQQFQRLLEVLNLPTGIADAVVDWIDPDQIPELNGAEDDYYTGLDPPYRAANSWLTSVSEIRAIKGIDAEVYEKLAPHVAALPIGDQPTKINVNTATDAVLQSLGASLDCAQVRGLTGGDSETGTPGRDGAGFADISAFQGKIDPAMAPYLGVTSNFFGVNVAVSIGTTRMTMYSLLQRNGSNVSTRLRSFDLDPMPEPQPLCEIPP